MSWDDLRFALALARHKTAKAAATALRVNATTVSRRVQALEDELGIKLFDRLPEGASLTDAGRAAVSAAERIEIESLELDAELRGLEGDLRGALTISMIQPFADLWAADLAAFGRDHPAVQLALSSSNRLDDLSRRETDVALRLTVAPPDDVVGKRLCEVFFSVYISKTLAETQLERSTATYRDVPWIGWREPFSAATDRVIAQYAPGALVPLRVDSMKALGNAVQHGMGASVMPCFVGDRISNVVRLGPYFEGGSYLWALIHPQLRRTARVGAFRTRVAAWVERDRPLFLGHEPTEPAFELANG